TLTPTSKCAAIATAKTTAGLDLRSTFQNLIQDVILASGTSNIGVTDYSISSSATQPVLDNGTNNMVQILSVPQGNSTKITGLLAPAVAGGTDVGSSALPFANMWLGNTATNNIKLTGTATAARVATLPDNSGPIEETLCTPNVSPMTVNG